MAMNRFIKSAMSAAGRAGVSRDAVAGAMRRFMGQGDRVQTRPHPMNPERPRNFSTDPATGRHRSISNATANRYKSYGVARAKGNAARGATAAGVVGMAAMMGKGENPEAQAEERNPAEESKQTRRNTDRKEGGPRRGGKRGNRKTNERKGQAARKGGNDKASFDAAFKAARAAYKSGRTNATSFSWKGKSYSIVTKDDIKQAGSKDLKEFLNKGGTPKRNK